MISRIALLCLLVAAPSVGTAQDDKPWWSQAVAAALTRAGDNRPELRKALQTVPRAHREDLAFLVEHMPPTDLERMQAAFLLENVALAREVMTEVPWGKSIPRRIFLNDILPYANVSETREAWRKGFKDRFLPLVKECKTPGEAAQKLNQKVFGLLQVKYSTRRRRADQSPAESIDSGVASCTGLSILLTDACRAVGVPARLAGIPRWVNKRGNHTWVEVWDGGWHFTGAAEWNKNGLDHTWFQRDAALAKADEPMHSIWAVSYKKTENRFPMVWARNADPVSGVNVTARYTKVKPPAAGLVRLMVRVRQRPGGPRVAAAVTVAPRAQPKAQRIGRSKGEENDTNDFLSFDLDPQLVYRITVTHGARTKVITHRLSGQPEELLDVDLQERRAASRLEAAAAKWFATPAAERRGADKRLDELVAEDEAAARRAVWRAFQRAPLHKAMRADFAKHRVRSGKHESPYTVKEVGERPTGGWPLFIAMHGGGGVPKRFNDSQWRHMQVYYKDQPDVGGYKYVALRAPNDSWNGFYDHYVWPLIERLVTQFTVCGDVDPNKVFLMGYSHGGYGTFAIAANIPDRFAAAHASASAPTGGITPVENFRALRFTYMVGGRDTAYGRADRCKSFDKAVQKLRGERDDVFDVTLEFKPNNGHGGLPDRNKIRSMYAAVRRPMPREISWHTTGSTVHDFYWLGMARPAGGRVIHARCQANTIDLTAKGGGVIRLGLDSRLVDFGKPVVVKVNGATTEHRLAPSFATLCASMQRRGDPELAYVAELEVAAAAKGGR